MSTYTFSSSPDIHPTSTACATENARAAHARGRNARGGPRSSGRGRILAAAAAASVLVAGCSTGGTDTAAEASTTAAATAAASGAAAAATTDTAMHGGTTAGLPKAAKELHPVTARPMAQADDPGSFTAYPEHPGGIVFLSPDGASTCELYQEGEDTVGGCAPSDNLSGGGVLDGRTPPAGAFVTAARERTIPTTVDPVALAKNHSVTLGSITCAAVSDKDIRCDHLGTGELAVFDGGLIVTDPSGLTDSTGAHLTASPALDFFFDGGDTRAALVPMGRIEGENWPTKLALDMDTNVVAGIDAPGEAQDANALILDFGESTPSVKKAMGNAAGGTISADIQRGATYRTGPFVVNLNDTVGVTVTDLRTGGQVTVTDSAVQTSNISG